MHTKAMRVAGSAVAGAIGFVLGFYVGVFAVLSIWGLDAESVWYPVLTTSLGSLFAGGGIALTVRRTRRLAAIVTALALGALLVMVVVGIDAGLAVAAVGGLTLVVVTAAVTRAGSGNALFT